jgi:adenylate cyclase
MALAAQLPGRADRSAVRPRRGGSGLRRALFAEPDRTSPERIAESWSRFRDGIPPVLPDLGLPPHDQVFAAAIAGRPVVLSVAGGPEGEVPAPLAGIAVTGALPPGLAQFPAAVVNLPDLTAAAAGLGTISLGRSGDGVTRTVPLVSVVGETLMPALSVELLRVAQGAGGHILRTTEGSGEVSGGTVAAVAMRTGALSYPVEADGAFRIHFSGDRPGRVTPVTRVLEAEAHRPRACRARLGAHRPGRLLRAGALRHPHHAARPGDRGRDAPCRDHRADRVGAIPQPPRLDAGAGNRDRGAERAVADASAAEGAARPEPRGGAGPRRRAGLGGIVAFARAGVLFDPVLPVLTALGVFLPGTTIGVLSKERDRRAIRARFAYFLPPALIARIEANPEAALTPGGAERDLSVMFVDMRGFSTVTEGMPPERVVQLVNTYLSAVADALVDRGATIDKFIGDAVMAFWNAPIAQEDHAAAALGAIAEVERAAAAATERLEAEGLPPVRVAIGLNTGKAHVGLMGSRDRLSYTCVGDAVTLAARLEGLTRSYGVTNCVGPEAAAACPPGLRAVVLDRIAVKGFRRAVDVFTVLPDDAPGFAAFAGALGAGRAAYLAQDWDAADQAFSDLAMQTPGFCDTALLARLYLDRIAAWRLDPPGPDWDGAEVALSKR